MPSGPSSSSSSQAVVVVSSPESESHLPLSPPSEATLTAAEAATEMAHTAETLAEGPTSSAVTADELIVSAVTLPDDTLTPTATHTTTASVQEVTVSAAAVVGKAQDIITPFDFPPEAFDLG